MATLIKTTGEELELIPANGKTLTMASHLYGQRIVGDALLCAAGEVR